MIGYVRYAPLQTVKLGSLLPTPGPLSTGGARDNASGAISASASVRQAAALMSKRRSGILVEGAGRTCVGILTPKDLLFRVVAAGLSADTTTVQTVMTPQPDTMAPSDSVLDALRQLQGSGYRNVPVVSSSGEPFGVLDILNLMQGALHSSASLHSSAASERGSTRTTSERAESFCAESLADESEVPAA